MKCKVVCFAFQVAVQYVAVFMLDFEI